MDQQRSIAVRADGSSIVTKANALIEASYNLTLNEQRIILACAAKLDGRKPMPRDAVFMLDVDEFAELFGTDSRNAYTEMEEAVTKLYERDIRRIDGKVRKRLRWVYMAEYRKGEGKVRLGFSPEIAPYLTMLHRRFTSYRLEEIARLRSAYAIRLFEMLAQYVDTGVFVITVDEFKQRFGIEEKYDRFSNLKARVIQPAVDDLQAKTSLDISWQGIKKGKSVVRLEFRFEEKTQLYMDL
ncbi:MAG: replication initiation protein [Lamprobacter sp.]|uniref:replication initiation protein n=1 Tax=Lamprobacter sp. TaxID=3100796 RepID=UPI002B26461B|nr:replication initiation protein [Lamprobacter sp.]MEA3641961.1 replication initiation protein [Lamprobacter sp.]